MRLSPPGLDLCPTGPGVWGAASGGKRGVRSPLLVTAPLMVLTRHEDNVRAQGIGRAVPPGPAGRAAQPSSLTGTGPGSSRPVSLCDTITHPPPWLHFNVVLPGRSPPRVPPSEACSQASSCLWGTSSPVPLSQVQGGGPGLHVTPGVLAPVLWGPSCLLPAGSFQPRGPRPGRGGLGRPVGGSTALRQHPRWASAWHPLCPLPVPRPVSPSSGAWWCLPVFPSRPDSRPAPAPPASWVHFSSEGSGRGPGWARAPEGEGQGVQEAASLPRRNQRWGDGGGRWGWGWFCPLCTRRPPHKGTVSAA